VLVNLSRDTRREHRVLYAAGLGLIALITGLLALSVAIYQKVFEPAVMVTIEADRAGMQLVQFSDVRLNGVLVGQVREVDQEGDLAKIRVALQPEAAESIPADLRVAILPTTLFGQKYIDLVLPETSAAPAIADGDVVPPARVQTSVELDRVLGRLFPLLRAVRPADLNSTLNALATALADRGAQIGRNIEELDTYLTGFNVALPELRQDIELLGEVAGVYGRATPDFVRLLGNLSVTADTVTDQRRELSGFFTEMTGLSQSGKRFFDDNGSALIRLGQVSRPVLQLLETYAPEYPCLLQGLQKYDNEIAAAYAGKGIEISLEVGTQQFDNYGPDDRPVNGEWAQGRGPWCLGLPNPPIPASPPPLRDGSDADEVNPTVLPPLPGLLGREQQTSYGASSGYAGTGAEQHVIAALLAGRSGQAADSIPGFASLLYGPVVRGTDVRA
jgi:phospholipid/cholesterol/gamma-HCH transport system substrate-binding protein